MKVFIWKKTQVLIDIWWGILDWKPAWDFNFETINVKKHMRTPVPGWVGPVTISCIFANLADIKNKKSSFKPKEKSDDQKVADALRALKEKAGNIGAFKVSQKYKSKCSSCHGVNGSGFQNGKKMMGPKLFGQTEEVILKDLRDFKSGRKENMIMKGLLMSLNDNDLQELAKEIGEFPARAAAQKNK